MTIFFLGGGGGRGVEHAQLLTWVKSASTRKGAHVLVHPLFQDAFQPMQSGCSLLGPVVQSPIKLILDYLEL